MMGRTVPSWRMALEEEAKRWNKFARILRREDRPIFEEMVDEARRYACEASAAAFPSQAEGMLLSILFSHHKMLKALGERLDELTQRLNR